MAGILNKRKAQDVPIVVDGDAANLVEITPLGAGQEVGRSCIILKYQGKTVMFDCGIHPGFQGVLSLPYLDGNEDVDISKVDVALITHFHLDHCAAVPYLLSKTKFRGRVFMTHPTKVIYHTLLKDFAKGAKGSSDEALYGEEELIASMERIEVVDFMQTLEVAGGIKITPYRAGHVLGAAMFLVEIAGMRCLYTGDYSRVPDRHLPAADTPPVTPDIVIVESTYGVSRHMPREQRESLFLQRVTDTLRGGGRVLLPVVALGRAQELLLMLDEHWEAHPELQGVPIYQASGQMRKSMRVYETYVEMMNDDIRALFQHHNPFNFKHVTHLKSASHFDDVGPCVMMATPSGLQSGVSREAFEAWCDDRRNTVIICDFAVQGTLAREILGGPREILTKTGLKKPLRCGVAHISFSAHADYDQTSGFLDEVRPPHVVLVHGEKTEMMRLKGALEKRAAELGCARALYTPAVMQTVKIQHQPLRVVRMAGRLAEKAPQAGQPVRGVLVAGPAAGGAGQQLLLHPDDLPAYTKLHRGRVTQRQALATTRPWPEMRLALEVMFEGVEGAGLLPVTSHSPPRAQRKEQGADGAGMESGPGKAGSTEVDASAGKAGSTALAVRVGDCVTVTYRQADASAGYDTHVLVEWEGGKVPDLVADAVVAVLLRAAAGEGEGHAPAGLPALEAAEAARRAAEAAGDAEAAARAELEAVAALMRAQFGPAKVDEEQGAVHVQVGGLATPDAQPVEVHIRLQDSCSSDGHGGKGSSGAGASIAGRGGCKVECADAQMRGRVDKAVRRLLEAMRPISVEGLLASSGK